MWQYYDGMHVVFQHRHYTPAELQEAALGASQSFYSWLGLANDALNIFFESSRSVTRLLGSGFHIPSLRNSLIKLQAKAIIRRWRVMNGDYLSYLRGTERSGVGSEGR